MDTLPAAKSSLAAPGGVRAVLEAAARSGGQGTFACVVETEGSTYVRPGAVALFGAQGEGQVGWLSGGCLEPEIARRADSAAASGRMEWLDIDTRDDEDLFAGSAVGCRGRLHLALLPLAAIPGWQDLLPAWRAGAGAMRWTIDTQGAVACAVAGAARQWRLTTSPREGDPDPRAWEWELPSPPTVLVFGAGPETSTLVPWLHRLGWMTAVVERRPRWSALAALSDMPVDESPQAALARLARRFDAALVMHHHFELDREALQALADTDIGYVGLLGPARRREDLFRVLPDAARAALQPRLRSPVGLDLGGQGPEAIALSIVAQLHAHRQRP
jgi:xanthine dehydrogenase accessory factor